MKLIQGDCFQILKTFEDKSIDVFFTSPPYNRKKNDKYENYDDCVDDYYQYLVDIVDLMMSKVKKHVILNIQPTFYNKVDVYRMMGTLADQIDQVFIWEKTNPFPSNGYNITNAWEYFIFFSDNPVKSNFTYTKNHISTSVNPDTSKIHKAVMNEEVPNWFIERFTKETDVICDPFMGLGTTGVSCIKLKRAFIGIELNDEYFRLAQDRLKAAQQRRTLI